MEFEFEYEIINYGVFTIIGCALWYDGPGAGYVYSGILQLQ